MNEEDYYENMVYIRFVRNKNFVLRKNSQQTGNNNSGLNRQPSHKAGINFIKLVNYFIRKMIFLK